MTITTDRVTSLDRYNLPASMGRQDVHPGVMNDLSGYELTSLDGRQNGSFTDAQVAAAARIICGLLRGGKYAREGLSQDVLWKKYNHTRGNGRRDQRRPLFVAAIKRLQQKGVLGVTTLEVSLNGILVGKTVVYQLVVQADPGKEDRRHAKRIAAHKAARRRRRRRAA